MLTIEIQDSGAGISTGDQCHLFKETVCLNLNPSVPCLFLDCCDDFYDINNSVAKTDM